MAARGRKPKTKEQKLAIGETRPHKLPPDNILEFPVVAEVPAPPSWVNAEGKKLWQKMAPALFRQKVLTEADTSALAHLCQLHGQIVQGYRRKIPPTAADLSQLRMYFSEFGMTPSSRTRIGITGDGKKENRFKKNGTQQGNDAGETVTG